MISIFTMFTSITTTTADEEFLQTSCLRDPRLRDHRSIYGQVDQCQNYLPCRFVI